MVRFLGSYVGDRITDIGAFGLPDIYESAYTSVDFVVSQQIHFARGLSVKLTGTNILDESREFTQGGEFQRSIDTGRSQTFTCDGVYRLLSADGAYGSIDYTYDAVGNGALWTMQAELFGSVLVFVIML